MLDVKQLLLQFHENQVDYILFGTLAAVAYGAALTTQDMDICPATNDENLARLAQALATIEAKPRVIEGWMSQGESDIWQPTPATIENLDHDYVTRFGRLDVCPYPYGSAGKLNRFAYESLAFRAVTLSAYGIPFQVAYIDDVIASKLSARRAKDHQVVNELLRIQQIILGRSEAPNTEAAFEALFTQ